MYAIVKIGGNQYRVQSGETIVVDRLDQEVGSTIRLSSILWADGDKVKLGSEAEKLEVVAKIVSHGQGEKIHIRRFRAKSRHHRHVGFRAQQTKISIESIGETKKTTPEKATKSRSTKKTAKK